MSNSASCVAVPASCATSASIQLIFALVTAPASESAVGQPTVLGRVPFGIVVELPDALLG